ncbi:YagK/YfjJ domain-containing protein [Castellaniella sp.]|uniref:YagK/YfjJ domain-containing protein n=1 Tax=Castellaniella sp. TaxID=1955812 RepID=UPI003A90CDDD
MGLNVRLLNSLMDFMHQVIYTDALPFRTVRGRASVPNEQMARYMPLLDKFCQLVFHDVALSPDLELFQREYRKSPISRRGAGGKTGSMHAWEDRCNDFVRAMRAEGKRIGIKAQIKDWRNGSLKNARRLKRYLDSLFDRYARIMVIRLDLYYHQGACRDAMQAVEWQSILQRSDLDARTAYDDGDDRAADPSLVSADDIPRVDIQTVLKDWSHFMDNARGKPSLFAHRIGYVAAVECARAGGYHIHAAFLFDGSKVHKDQYLADEIGDYWVKLTQGRGYFHNCNRQQYKTSVLGLIEHGAHDRRAHLLKVLGYLAKKDQMVRIKPSAKTKTFFTGQMPRSKTGRTGRPRRQAVEDESGCPVPDESDEIS